MAQRVTIQLVCDLCQDEQRGEEPATETFTVALSGPEYALDVCDQHAKALYELREVVQRVGRTERVGVRKEKPRPFNPNTKDEKRARTQKLNEIRAWAAANGFDDVGTARIPYRVHRAFNEANPDKSVPIADGGRGTARAAAKRVKA